MDGQKLAIEQIISDYQKESDKKKGIVTCVAALLINQKKNYF